MVYRTKRENIDFLLYDGDCPFCSSYVSMLNILTVSPNFLLLNARDEAELVAHYRSKGWEINDGMILKFSGLEYFGPDTIHFLALLTSNRSLILKANNLIFKSKICCKILYPLLVRLRKFYFFLANKSLISQ